MAFVCDYESCGKLFTRAEGLKLHKRGIHEGVRPYACDVPDCTKAYTQKRDLLRHNEDAHLKLRPYKCDHDDCDAAFYKKCDLNIHKRVHDRERPYKCDVAGCDKKYGLHCHLTQHVRASHLNVRIACDFEECTAVFTELSSMNKHKLTVHLNHRPYVCDHVACGREFALRSNLTQHVQSMHTEEGSRRQKRSENALAKAFDEAGIPYKREHVVQFDCEGISDNSFSRIDFVIIMFGQVQNVENDERQHDWIETVCDVKRMSSIVAAHALSGNTLPHTFTRFNPHAYRMDGVLGKVAVKDRHARLIAMLKDPASILYATSPPLKIQHMYYSTEGGIPRVLTDYGPLAECVLSAIV